MEEYARGLRHPDPGGLDTHGDTDADRLPVLLPGADFAVAGSLGGEVEEAPVITAVVNLSREAGLVRHRLGRDQVSAAELHRVESKLARKPVQHPLDTEIADRPSAAPDEARGWAGGRAGRDGEIHGRQPVGRDHVAGVAVAHHRAPGDVGPDRPVDAPAHAPQPAVGVCRQLEVEAGAMGLGRGQTVLDAAGNPADGTLQEPADGGGHHVLGVGLVLGSKAAADILRKGDDLFRLEAETAGNRVPEAVDPAHAGAHVKPLLRIVPVGEASPGLDGGAFDPGHAQLLTDRHRGTPERGVGVAEAVAGLDHVGLHQVRFGELHRHGFYGIRRLVVGLSGDHRHRLAFEADGVGGQDRPLDGRLHSALDNGSDLQAQLAGRPGTYHTRHRASRRHVHVKAPAARRARAAESQMHCPSRRQIGRIAAFASEQVRVFAPLYRLTDPGAHATSMMTGRRARTQPVAAQPLPYCSAVCLRPSNIGPQLSAAILSASS